MVGCIFILGKLEASFDGAMKTAQAEGTLRTNSPGLVLAVVGSVLIAISLTVTVQVEVNDDRCDAGMVSEFDSQITVQASG